MSHRLPDDDNTTQVRHPSRAVMRSSIAATAAIIPILWPLLSREIGTAWAVVAVVAAVAGNAIVTRFLAYPAVEAWLREVLPPLAANPDHDRRDRLDLAAPPAAVMASDTAGVLELENGGGVHASDTERVVSGLVVPWDEEGATTAGPLTVPPGAIRVPREIGRVKLLFKHTGTEGHKPVGHALGFEAKRDGLYMSFSIARTPDGDAAVTQIREGVYDAFSAELRGVKKTATRVLDSILTGVALVDRPAFDNARVHTLNAQYTDPDQHQEKTTMTVEAFIKAMIDAGATEADARAAAAAHFSAEEIAAVDVSGYTSPAISPADAGKTTTTATPPAAPAEAHAGYTPPRGAIVPAGLAGGTAATLIHASAHDAAATILAAAHNQNVVHAALTDITNSGLVDATPPEWLGEMWTGPAKTRQLVPLLNRRDLRSWRIQGFRWTEKPLVAAYAGDKTEIPTGPVAIAPYEAEATRWAGGHDLDRKFFDFKDAGILESYWRAMNESYAVVTDNAAKSFVVANAKTVTDAAATDLTRAMIVLHSAVDDALGVQPNYYLANPADKMALLDITNQQLPAYLSMFGVDPRQIVWTKAVPAGSMVAGVKPAVTFHELPGSPLRVEAEHLSHGGVDRAMFGYTAMTVDNADGLVKIAFSGE